ncbi:hypothetical protein BHAMNSH16_12920 [Brachyspira hampsonii]|uniref:ABC-three component systems C-terminal domain-containing protein n=2 Tax=Brachyspira hampsonii TaxID=1287055 RepID=A0AAC9TVU6_9SPIR|nr:ABC-three component system protein [Brachyspira hampsonii]ASJ22493.1 hypothetical protein BHAMNSH16_12920 [Brachyspira hampsonii]OEJ16886.1 hypothetical protein A9496_12530 [Brachyspira hampsonii]
MIIEEKKAICLLQFRQRLLFSSGQEFENLFTTLMYLLYPNDFQQVKPQGRYGDGGNDGYIKGQGIYFQVYSPEKIDPKNTNKIKKKIEKDLEKLINNWDNLEKIKEYNFVFNDNFENIDLTTNQFFIELQNKYQNIDINIKTSHWIINKFADLSLEKQLYILEHIPLNIEGFDFIKLDLFGNVIKYIINNIQIPNNIHSILEAPDFDEKIKVNGLKDFKILLQNAYLQTNILDDFYKSNPEDKMILQKKVINLYKEELYNSINYTSLDSVFYKISYRMIPNIEEYNNLSNINKKNIMESIYVILAYFFQVCDIGKAPDKFNKN